MTRLTELPYLFAMDTPLPVAAPEGLVRVKGWCFLADGPAPISVRLRAAGLTLPSAAFTARADVKAAFPDHPHAEHSGFEIEGYVPPGVHCARLEAGSDAAGWMLLREFSVVVHVAPLLASIDLPPERRITANTSIEGWCLHPQFEIAELYLHYGNIVVRVPFYGEPRADVGASHPYLPHARRTGFSSDKRLRRGAGPVRLRAVTRCGRTFFAATRHEIDPQARVGWTPSDPVTGGEGPVAPPLFTRLKRIRTALPVIAFVCPTGDDPARLEATLRSLTAQFYDGWELYLAGRPAPGSAVAAAAASSTRIRFLDSTTTADVLRAAARDSAADFLILLQPGDRLTDTALPELVLALHAAPATDVVALANAVGDRLVPPVFWSLPALCAGTVETDLPFLVRRTRFLALGDRATGDGPAAALEMLLRLAEEGARFARHTALLVVREPSAFRPAAPDAAVIAASLARRGREARVELADNPRRCVLRPATALDPFSLQAVVVHRAVGDGELAATLKSLHAGETTALRSTTIVTAAPLEPADAAAARRFSAAVVETGRASFAAGINRAAEGDARWLLLVTSGTRFLSAQPFAHLCLHADDPQVAAVGALLVRAAGGVVSPSEQGGVDAALLRAVDPRAAEAADRTDILCTREVPLLSLDALVVPRAVFTEVAGFSAAFAGAGWDLDFFLRLRQRGRLLLVCAEARALVGDPAAPAPAAFDRALLLDRWQVVANGKEASP